MILSSNESFVMGLWALLQKLRSHGSSNTVFSQNRLVGSRLLIRTKTFTDTNSPWNDKCLRPWKLSRLMTIFELNLGFFYVYLFLNTLLVSRNLLCLCEDKNSSMKTWCQIFESTLSQLKVYLKSLEKSNGFVRENIFKTNIRTALS